MDIGTNMKLLREGKGITMANLANVLDVSSSHISQIENNKTNPSISMLKKIAYELEVPITYFFSETEQTSPVIRRGERKSLSVPRSQLIYELLSPPEARDFQFLLTRIEVDGKMGEEDSSHAGVECCYISSGTCQFTVKEETYLMTEGDSIFIPEHTVHNAINVGDEDVVIISVISPGAF